MLRLLNLGLAATTATVGKAEAISGNLEVQQVTDNVVALLGPLGERSPENLSNNATYGVVVTSDGVVRIDSGGPRKGARRIYESISLLTKVPVKLSSTPIVRTIAGSAMIISGGMARESLPVKGQLRIRNTGLTTSLCV